MNLQARCAGMQVYYAQVIFRYLLKDDYLLRRKMRTIFTLFYQPRKKTYHAAKYYQA
jgi:hypothetical protein